MGYFSREIAALTLASVYDWLIKLIISGWRDPTDLRGTMVLGPSLLSLGLHLGLQSNLPAGELESHLYGAR